MRISVPPGRRRGCRAMSDSRCRASSPSAAKNRTMTVPLLPTDRRQQCGPPERHSIACADGEILQFD